MKTREQELKKLEKQDNERMKKIKEEKERTDTDIGFFKEAESI